ncbi:MAG: hypothetical protein ABFC96_10510 [Thermoguttaceae bacterium]
MADETSQAEVMRQFEQEHGPFDPPPEFQFESEFRNAVPRPIPSELYRGRHFGTIRLQIITSVTAGAVSLVLYCLPITQTWGLFVLPLQYLHWIAAALFASAAVAGIRYLMPRGPLTYVQDGVPLAARIVALSVHDKGTVHNVPLGFEYVATIQHQDPETGKFVISSVKHVVASAFRNTTTLSYTVGDYVTAVYLRSNPEKSLQLYGFLGLRPGLGVVSWEKSYEWTPAQVIAPIGRIGAVFLAGGWSIYVMGKLVPLELSLRDQGPPLVLGAIVFGGGMLVRLGRRNRRAKEAFEAYNRAAAAAGAVVDSSWRRKPHKSVRQRIGGAIFVLAVLVLGAIVMLILACTVNSLCDFSPAVLRPVHINRMQTVTHDCVLREYEIEYEFVDVARGEYRKMSTTPWHMDSFGQNCKGFAHVRSGFLGWPWVETLTPRNPNWAPVPPAVR